jgi:tetratricopeptide (TPR) repeat protein
LLLDFGIARLLLPDSNPQWAARAFTPRYAAPEQFAGELPTVATDIYSLGIILFELLVGRTPYEIRDDVICLQPVPVVQAVEKSRAREIGRDLAAIVAKAIEVRAQDRYATISEFLEDLTRCRRHQTVKAMPDSSWYRARKFVRRYQTVVSLAAALLIAIVVGAGLSVQQAKLAVRERDRAVQMLEQSAATNEFWNTVLAEGVANDEVVSMQDLLERSELIAERAAASSPLQYAVAIDSIASLYLSYGLPAKAETLIARTLEQYQGIEEGKHVMCHLRCEYALAIGTLGRMEEADTLFSQVLQGVENEPSVKQYCLQSRAAVAGENFDVANALNYIEEAYQLQLQSPIRSPWVLAQLDGELAYAYVLNGKSDLAQERYDSAWKVFEAIGREESHVAMGVLNGWGILAMGTGDPAEALKIFDRAIEIARKRLPAGHPPPDLLFNQAMALAALGRYHEAVRQFDRLRKRALADDNENMAAGAVAGAADAYLQAGDFAGAEQLINGLTESERATLAPDSARMLRLAVVNARLLAKQQKYDAADKVLTQVLASFERKGAIIRRRVIAMTFHADLLLAMGRTDAAAVEARRALEMAQLTRGKKLHSDLVGLARSAQGKVQLAQGERAAAVESLQAAIEDLKFTLGAEHPDTQAAQALIASMPMT